MSKKTRSNRPPGSNVKPALLGEVPSDPSDLVHLVATVTEDGSVQLELADPDGFCPYCEALGIGGFGWMDRLRSYDKEEAGSKVGH